VSEFRIGHGFDVHAFDPERELVIGGIVVPHDKGLAGHSDADVLLHAIMDALLGAAGLPDIGQQFPPDDPAYEQADSAVLLSRVGQMVRTSPFPNIVNIDAVIMAERPKMNPHIPKMKKAVADILHLNSDRINIKATTTEGLGFTGREEGIAASAVCLLSGND
jgi:2-C-methyl-D-erythritol 2,4-cyclodiphosphate synthase